MQAITQPYIDQILAIFRQFSRYDGRTAATGYEAIVASKIKEFHAVRRPISMLLPAFPWKNPNTDKVLSLHPDLGEELSLARLNHLCEEIEKVYSYGASITLVADGPVYNDLLGIPDADFYDYGIQLRAMAKEKGFSHIKFLRLMDALDLGDSEKTSRDQYLAISETCRREMESRYLGPNFDLHNEIEKNKDTGLTYQKYVKSAREDLLWGPDIASVIKQDPALYAAETTRVAKRMTDRLLAYERALEAKYLDFIRLSIHAGTGKVKISIPLIPQPNAFGLMPWHSCLLVTAKGEYRTGQSKDFRDRDKYELVLKNGKPYCLRERHPDFTWPAHVKIYHEYGGQAVVVNTSTKESEKVLSKDERQKLGNLAVTFGGLQVRGFTLDV